MTLTWTSTMGFDWPLGWLCVSQDEEQLSHVTSVLSTVLMADKKNLFWFWTPAYYFKTCKGENKLNEKWECVVWKSHHITEGCAFPLGFSLPPINCTGHLIITFSVFPSSWNVKNVTFWNGVKGVYSKLWLTLLPTVCLSLWTGITLFLCFFSTKFYLLRKTKEHENCSPVGRWLNFHGQPLTHRKTILFNDGIILMLLNTVQVLLGVLYSRSTRVC